MGRIAGLEGNEDILMLPNFSIVDAESKVSANKFCCCELVVAEIGDGEVGL
jgi:hypothetical protein